MSDTNTAVVAGLSTTGTGFGRTGICKVIKGPPAAALPDAPGAADCATAAPPLVASMRPPVKRTVRMSVVMLDPLLAVSVNIDRRRYRASELPSERVNRAWDMQEIQPKMRHRASSKMVGLAPMSGRAVLSASQSGKQQLLWRDASRTERPRRPSMSLVGHLQPCRFGAGAEGVPPIPAATTGQGRGRDGRGHDTEFRDGALNRQQVALLPADSANTAECHHDAMNPARAVAGSDSNIATGGSSDLLPFRRRSPIPCGSSVSRRIWRTFGMPQMAGPPS